jgi:hypothetical protein
MALPIAVANLIPQQTQPMALPTALADLNLRRLNTFTASPNFAPPSSFLLFWRHAPVSDSTLTYKHRPGDACLNIDRACPDLRVPKPVLTLLSTLTARTAPIPPAERRRPWHTHHYRAPPGATLRFRPLYA